MIGTGLTIESPEGISFSYELASLSERGKAYGIDLLIRAAAVVVVGLLLGLILGAALLAGVGLWLIIYFVVEWGYYVLFEVFWDGQSPGKRLFNLRVVKSAGHPIGFYDSLLRNLLRAADALPLSYAAGVIAVLSTRRFQRLGDLAADTVVVQEQKAWYGGRHLRKDPALAAVALRGLALSNRERRLLDEFVARKDRLHPERREQLAAILAEPYRKRLALPEAGSATELLVRLHATASQEQAS
ncbi:MAG: RDD family protein [Deltaproteobacteria bacterium]|nr:RDD family protein [Deltaproteobacteria bacterium]